MSPIRPATREVTFGREAGQFRSNGAGTTSRVERLTESAGLENGDHEGDLSGLGAMEIRFKVGSSDESACDDASALQ